MFHNFFDIFDHGPSRFQKTLQPPNLSYFKWYMCFKSFPGDFLQRRLIDKKKIDVGVMASHGEKGHFHFGSVTEKVLKNSSVPVTTTPVDLKNPSDSQTPRCLFVWVFILKTEFGLKGPELIVEPDFFPQPFVDIQKQAEMLAFPARKPFV